MSNALFENESININMSRVQLFTSFTSRTYYFSWLIKRISFVSITELHIHLYFMFQITILLVVEYKYRRDSLCVKIPQIWNNSFLP